MDEDDIKHIPPSEIHSDESAEDLLDSLEMKPYMRLAMAEMKGAGMGAGTSIVT